MARIAGVELPNNKKIIFALPYIYGIGRTNAIAMVTSANVDPNKRVRDLTEVELAKIQKEVEKNPVEGDLRRQVGENIKRLEQIGSYRGMRHRRGLPAHGQRTRSNARTKRGKRVTIGAMKKDDIVKMENAAKAAAVKK